MISDPDAAVTKCSERQAAAMTGRKGRAQRRVARRIPMQAIQLADDGLTDTRGGPERILVRTKIDQRFVVRSHVP